MSYKRYVLGLWPRRVPWNLLDTACGRLLVLFVDLRIARRTLWWCDSASRQL